MTDDDAIQLCKGDRVRVTDCGTRGTVIGLFSGFQGVLVVGIVTNSKRHRHYYPEDIEHLSPLDQIAEKL